MIPGATPLGVGISGAMEGFAAFADGEAKVIAKHLPHPELAAELYCSLLARELTLPCAPPALLLDVDGHTLLYGSLDEDYPNFSQFVRLDPHNPDPVAMDRFFAALRTWARAPEVASFDAWIDNRDRNPGNWLWRSQDDWLLIDHGKALGVDPGYPRGNKLHTFLTHASPDPMAQARLRQAMIGAAIGFSEMHAQLAQHHMPPAFAAQAQAFCAMLENTCGGLAAAVGNLFAGQQMLT